MSNEPESRPPRIMITSPFPSPLPSPVSASPSPFSSPCHSLGPTSPSCRFSVGPMEPRSLRVSQQATSPRAAMTQQVSPAVRKAVCTEDKPRMVKRPSLPQLSLDAQSIWSQNVSKILDYLYIGSEDIPAQTCLLRSLNITHIVNAQCVSHYQHGQGPEYVQLDCRDDVDERISHKFEPAFVVIEDARKRGLACLVHCKHGMSRSPTVVIAYLIRYKSWSLIEAFKYVRERRPCVSPNPGFMQQLVEYERQVLGSESLDVQRYEDDRFGSIKDLLLRPGRTPRPSLPRANRREFGWSRHDFREETTTVSASVEGRSAHASSGPGAL